MHRWSLFVDESGRFDDPHDEAVVTGLLVRHGAPNFTPLQLRSVLRANLFELPWPPRAAEMHHPVLFAVAGEICSDSCRTGTQNATASNRASRRLVEILSRVCKDDLDAVLEALQSANKLPYERLARLDRAARDADPVAHRLLRHRADASAAAISRCIGTLASSERSSVDAFLIACGETTRGDTADEDDGTRRYLCLLEGLFTRAADVLGRLKDRHEVRIEVLQRHLFDEQVGRSVPANPRLIGPAVRRAEERCRRSVGEKKVHLVLDRVLPYDGRMHPALMLADFAANRVRRVLMEGPRLEPAEQDIFAQIPCPVRSGRPPASHLAAAGLAEELVEKARAGSPARGAGVLPQQNDETQADARVWAAAEPSGARPWAVEQAWEWAGVLGV